MPATPGFSVLPGFRAPFCGDRQSTLNPGTTVLIYNNIINLLHFYIYRSGSVRSENLENSLKSMVVGSYMTLDRRNSKGKNKRLS